MACDMSADISGGLNSANGPLAMRQRVCASGPPNGKLFKLQEYVYILAHCQTPTMPSLNPAWTLPCGGKQTFFLRTTGFVRKEGDPLVFFALFRCEWHICNCCLDYWSWLMAGAPGGTHTEVCACV